MYQLVTGPFHPVLEDSLVQAVQHQKVRAPLAPLAIVVPSERLRRRLQQLLCVERGLVLYDVAFLTFHQFALKLLDEQGTWCDDAEGKRYELVSDGCCRELLKALLLRNHVRAGQGYQGAWPPGAEAALWATLRDLREAQVVPAVVRQGLDEDVCSAHIAEELSEMMKVLVAVEGEFARCKIGTFDDLAATVTPWVASSEWVARFPQVFYYGFYDLTQIQLTLFEAVTRRTSVTCYVPVCDDPAFVFAKRFRDRYLSGGVSGDGTDAGSRPADAAPVSAAGPSHVATMSAIGGEEELILVCKEITRLREVHGYRFRDFGVMARTLDPYRPYIRRVFDQHRIPFTSSASMPFTHTPAAKLLCHLATLREKRFDARAMLEVLGSPYRAMAPHMKSVSRNECMLWKDVVATHGIRWGVSDWERLAALAGCDGVDGTRRSDSPANEKERRARMQAIHSLSAQACELIQACQELPQHGGVAELTDAFVKFVRRYVSFGEVADTESSPGSGSSVSDIEAAFDRVLEELHQIDRVTPSMSWEEWTELWIQVAQSTAIPFPDTSEMGVSVLDVMAARGLPFGVVFVVGMNEGVFPRVIREDAFLRDRARRALAETFGYKIDEKLVAHDEERLLHALCAQSARERLYWVFQGADGDGQQRLPSSFLGERARTNAADVSLPRSLIRRSDHPLFRESLLTPKELALTMLLQQGDPWPIMQLQGYDRAGYDAGRRLLEEVERVGGTLGAYDGVIGEPREHWAAVHARGVSPTSLECYARCPFQYFSRHVLALPQENWIANGDVSFAAMGSVCHAVLRAVYFELIRREWSPDALGRDALAHLVKYVTRMVCDDHGRQYGTGHWLLWQRWQDIARRLVLMEVEQTAAEVTSQGFRPIAVEVEGRGVINVEEGAESAMAIQGRVDRVDYHPALNALRIVDYKLTWRSELQASDCDMVAAGVRASRLQPPMYAMMSDIGHGAPFAVPSAPGRPSRVDMVFLFASRNVRVERTGVDSRAWDGSAGNGVRRTLSMLTDGIRCGHYYIVPDGHSRESYCRHCDLSMSCRRLHDRTDERVRRSSIARSLRQLRVQEVSDE